MKLYATPLSHFSRKVRLLLDHLGAHYAMVDVGNVAEAQPFGGNPLMTVPTLEDGETRIFGSDAIARYVVDRLDPGDRYAVRAATPMAMNRRVVMNGVMDQEVKLILAERTGSRTDTPVSSKARLAIRNGLAWLEERAESFDAERPGYAEFHLAAMWDHLDVYGTVPLDYPRLRARAVQLAARSLFSRSGPRALPRSNRDQG